MQFWRWNGANDRYTTLLPAHDADLHSGVFTADGSLKTGNACPQVKPPLEKHGRKQLPLGDLSFARGGRASS